MGEGSAAHEGDRRDLDLARRDTPLDLLGRQHVIEGIIERAQIGIDFLAHVAGKKAEAFAGLDRRPRQDQPVDRTGDQLLDGLGNGQIGLAAAGRTEREHHLRPAEGFDIACLCRSPGRDGLAPGVNDGRRHPPTLVGRDGGTGTARHCDRGLDIAGIDGSSLFQPRIEAAEHVAGPRGIDRLALDLHPVAPRSDIDTKPVFDGDQMLVELAEQRAEQSGPLELELDARPRVPGFRRRRRNAAALHHIWSADTIRPS